MYEYLSTRFEVEKSFVDAETRIQTRVNFIERGRRWREGQEEEEVEEAP